MTALSPHNLLADPVKFEEILRTKSESYFISRGKKIAYALYKDMAKSVPAYQSFLTKHRVQSMVIRSADEFHRLPLCNKDNYLRAYSLDRLCWDGNLSGKQWTIAATSGSTGEPYYFPHTHEQDLQYAALAEMYLRSNFAIHKKSTLYIIGWGMGVWIGGVFSYAAVRLVAERGKYALSVITPGPSKEEIIKAVKSLGHFYDQIIIGGYPPMIKDLVDEAPKQGVLWKNYSVKFIFSAEGFSETFRDYIVKHACLRNVYLDTLNHYGTVDMGTMAHETPLTILIRRLAVKNTSLNEALFGHSHRQPTLAQYIPELFYFEEQDGRVICSSNSGLPLVRYDFFDTGGVKTLDSVQNICASCGVHLKKEIQKAGIEAMAWNLPFVYVFERSDFTVKFYGANIYPQEIRRVLEHKEFSQFVTGKCTMEICFTDGMNQELVVHIELAPEVVHTKEHMERIQTGIIDDLLRYNSEYANNYRNLGKDLLIPRIMFWPYASREHFTPLGKHRWVRKT